MNSVADGMRTLQRIYRRRVDIGTMCCPHQRQRDFGMSIFFHHKISNEYSVQILMRIQFLFLLFTNYNSVLNHEI